MRMFDEAHSYATPENAIKQLDKALAPTGLKRSLDVRWAIIVNSAGRFVPVIYLHGVDLHLTMHFSSNHVAVSSF